MSIVMYIILAGACVALGLIGRPTIVAVSGMLSVFLLAALSVFVLRETIAFLLVPIMGSSSIALLRTGKVDTRASLGLSFVPLFTIVSLTSAAVVFSAGLLAAWRGNVVPRFWAAVVIMLPTFWAVLIFVRQQG